MGDTSHMENVMEWSVTKHWRTPLYLLMRSFLGERRGAYVYIIGQGIECIYVGQTRQGVRLRLWKHVAKFTPISDWIRAHEFDEETVWVDVLSIAGDLNAAERYYIARESPITNQILYKSADVVLPTSTVDATIIEDPQAFVPRPYGLPRGAVQEKW